MTTTNAVLPFTTASQDVPHLKQHS